MALTFNTNFRISGHQTSFLFFLFIYSFYWTAEWTLLSLILISSYKQHIAIIFITESLYLLYINVFFLMLLHLAFIEAKVIPPNVSCQISSFFTRQRRKYCNNKVCRKDVLTLKACYLVLAVSLHSVCTEGCYFPHISRCITIIIGFALKLCESSIKAVYNSQLFRL